LFQAFWIKRLEVSFDLTVNKAYSFLKDLFETHIQLAFKKPLERLAVLDAFAQFSQNPTSMSAGYGVEKNYPFISQNLAKRYGLTKITVENIISFLRKYVDKMTDIEYDIYFWRQAISDYVKKKKSSRFLRWYKSLYNRLSQEEKEKFLFLIYAAKQVSSRLGLLYESQIMNEMRKWYVPFFNKEEKINQYDIENMLVKYGICNILYYRPSRGSERSELVWSLFLEQVYENFRNNNLVSDQEIKEYFENLSISDVRLLEACIKEETPALENRIGKITRTARLIVEASKSYFAVSPFAYEALRNEITNKKIELTSSWSNKLNNILNYFVREVYPYAELKVIFENEGAYCWELRYAATLEKEPINVGILISPYIFLTSPFSTILEEMKRALPLTKVNIIILIKETLPTIAEKFKSVSQRNLIFLLDEKEENFYLIERKPAMATEEEILIDAFLSRFLPVMERVFPISKTWPTELEQYLENLKYYNKFPRLVILKNRIPEIERKLRQTLRNALENKFGPNWKVQIKEKIPDKVKKFEGVIQKRLDKEFAEDFLDGATLGELVELIQRFTDITKRDKMAESHLHLINKYRNVLEHPIKKQEEDIDERTFNQLNIALDYIQKVICT